VAVSYERRWGWVVASIEWFESLDPAQGSVRVPACPAWTIDGLRGHLAWDGMAWVTTATLTPATVMNRERGLRLLDPVHAADQMSGALRTFASVLASHEPGDECVYPFAAPQNFDSWSCHAVTELLLHRVDAAEALGGEASADSDEVVCALSWLVEVWLPGLAGRLDVSPPVGTVEFVSDEGGAVRVGSGEPVVPLTGSAFELLRLASGRGAWVGSEDRGVGEWWAGLLTRTAQHTE